ncbi:MAG TPA: DUF6754 domain-containing protein [Candidatus Limnocylindria bacterium]|nr:DUF6754 domain-containing protein [Candidatus Limnocylindria bacterium]
MPDIGALVADLLDFIGEQIGASSLRLGAIPTVALLGIVLVLLSLIARPTTRWVARDLGRMAAVSRAMALAAESGGAAAFSLGSAGVARAASSFDRLQTLAAIPVLGHVARAAARAGVPLRVTANDPVANHLADVALDAAHRETETEERQERSTTEYVGEGRGAAAAVGLAEAGAPAAAFVDGGLAEEALLLLDGAREGASWTSFGTAASSQAGSVLLEGEGSLIGPELFQAPSDLRAGGHERIAVLAANRIIVAALVTIALGSLLAVVSGTDLAGVLAGR